MKLIVFGPITHFMLFLRVFNLIEIYFRNCNLGTLMHPYNNGKIIAVA